MNSIAKYRTVLKQRRDVNLREAFFNPDSREQRWYPAVAPRRAGLHPLTDYELIWLRHEPAATTRPETFSVVALLDFARAHPSVCARAPVFRDSGLRDREQSWLQAG